VVRHRLCIIGDALLDIDWEGEVRRVCRDAPAPVVDAPVETARAGGAGLAATLAAGAGAEVTLVTALSRDADGRRLAELLAAAGVDVVDLRLDGPTPVKLRVRSGGQSLARVDRGCEPVVAPGSWNDAATAAIASADAVLVSDYGRGMAALEPVAEIEGIGGGRPVVWDPHSDGARPPAAVTLATPNAGEASGLLGQGGSPPSATPEVVALAGAVSTALGCPVALTAGERGAVLAEESALPVVVPSQAAQGDPCGAGDAFSVAAALALAGGASAREAVEEATAAAGAYVAREERAVDTGERSGSRKTAGPGARRTVVPLARPGDSAARAVAEVAAVRLTGGVVVAAGGCFDLLHAGHVRLLEQARGLGDHLVVLINGDESVRRLKGRGRPLNPVDDRVAVLRSLTCVDEVVVFDEDTPSEALRALRPHLFVKGADYQGAEIEERQVLAPWGGQVVLVPLVEGRSTTRLIHTAAAAGE
jgi:D-beta-D-heptose 7-phosphate kinase / D-beta-D-heptose 1-phosphate adenosyltransferase